jgi:hypothetical protein
LRLEINLKTVLLEINATEADNIIGRYAIGGAVGVTFYLEPVATLDVNIFISFHTQPGSLLISPQPVFKYLTERGARIEGEYVIIADWPVQFLPPTGPLVEEALAEAVEFEVEEIRTRVFTAEHLAAIALQTGRPKDKARLLQFTESDTLSWVRFQSILERHALAGSWRKFEQHFLES